MSTATIDIDVAKGEMVVSTTLRTYEEFSRFCTAMNAARDVLWDRESDQEPEVAPRVPRKNRKMTRPAEDSPRGRILAAMVKGHSDEKIAGDFGKKVIGIRLMRGKFKKAKFLK